MALEHTVTLKHSISGAEIDCWSSYEVVQDMFDAGNPWTFTLWRSAESDTGTDAQRRIVAWNTVNDTILVDDEITLSIDGAQQLVGIVESLEVVADPKGGTSVVLSGRDLAGPMISGDADPAICLRNRQLSDALHDLFEPYSVTVVFGHPTDAMREVQTRQRPGSRGTKPTRRTNRIDLTHPKPGEKTWQILEGMLKQLGLMAWIAPMQGTVAVVIDVPNYSQEPLFTFWRTMHSGVVSQDSNIISSKFRVQTQNVPSVVNVYSSAAREDGPPARSSCRIVNEGLDTARVRFPHRYRPVHMLAERARTPDRARQEGQRRMNEAMIHHRVYTGVIQGHGQWVRASEQHPTLFAVNTTAGVIDQISNINEAMMIQRLVFRGSNEGAQTTEVSLGTLGAIVLTPEPPA